MKLSSTQIAQIKSWISKRGFTHTDVQYEILDHVASAIEDKMEKDSDLSLEKAFSLTHAEFGIFGFNGIEESTTKSISKELWKSCLLGFRKILSSQRVLIPILLVLLLHYIHHYLNDYFYWSVYFLLFGFSAATLLDFLKLYYNNKHLKNFLSFRISFASIISIIMLPLQIYYHLQNFLSPLGTILLLILFVCIEWAITIGAHQMVKRSQELYKLYASCP